MRISDGSSDVCASDLPLRAAFPIAALPVIGLIGGIIATWRARANDNVVGWVAVTLFSGFATTMLLWQVRAGPAAQLLAVPGVTALAWLILPWFRRQRSVLVRVAGPVAGFILQTGRALWRGGGCEYG